jgi:putative heme-binding domain-containing protein
MKRLYSLVCLLAGLTCTADWVSLFDGKTLEGWTERNKSGSFRVENGAIVGTAKVGLGTTFLCTDRLYGDFELEFETKVHPNLNSGVQIRSRNRPPKGKQTVGPVEGPQVEISCKSPDESSFSGNIFGQSWGQWLTPKDGRRNHSFMKHDDWNHVRVLAKGDQVTTWINGQEVITTTIPAERQETNATGFIGLQLHGIKDGGPYEAAWRNLRIRELRNSESRIRLTHQGPKQPFPKLPAFKDHSMSVFATAPEINSPVSVVAEPGGAVFALCDNNAGLGTLPGQGTVFRLVDENDDGIADFATRFIPTIDTPRGGHFVGDTLFLVHPPFISAYRDTTGDGVADEHKVLAKGFAFDHTTWTRGGDHTTNDLRVGIDGWIYVALGDFGATAVGSDGGAVTLLGGGVIRMRMDGSDLELYARGTRNTYDLAINHRLDILALDNTNDGDGWDMRLHHLTPLAHMGYPNLYKYFSDDAMPPLVSFGGGSGCGALFLEEPGFPDWFNGRFHTISWGNIYTHELTPHEATFVAASEISLKMQKLVDIDVDGSSRLYFNNFENGGARTEPGTTVGRIVQAKPKGWKPRSFPDLKAASAEQLIAHLDAGSKVLRQNAQLELVSRQGSGIEAQLATAAGDSKAALEARIAALYAINLRDGTNCVETLKALLGDPALCEYALRALLDRKDRDTLGLAPVIGQLLDHEDPRVRLQAIVGAQKLGLRDLTSRLLVLADGQETRTPLQNRVAHKHAALPHTARRALILMVPVAELHQALAKPELRQASLAVLRQIHSSDNVRQLTAALKLANPAEALELSVALMRLYHREHDWDGESWWSTRPNSAGPYYRGVTWEGSAAIADALRTATKSMSKDAQSTLLYQLRRHNLDVAELKLPLEVDPLEQLLDQPEHTFKQQVDLLAVATDRKRPDPMRLKAFRAALHVKGANYRTFCTETLKALKAVEGESELHATMAQEFVNSPSHRVTLIHQVPRIYPKVRKYGATQEAIYLDMICILAQSPLTNTEDREKVVGGMRRHPLSQPILASIARNKATAFLPMLQRAKDKKLAGAIAETIAALQTDERLVGAMPVDAAKKAVLSMTGNADLGKTLYLRQGCVACHSVLPNEPQKGPYLGTVGNLFNREQLITHVIQPGAEVAQGFLAHWFTLKDGSTTEGFVTGRDDKTIRLRNAVGIIQVIKTGDVVKEVTREGSMMPAGLVNGLTLHEFASLIDYLQSLH